MPKIIGIGDIDCKAWDGLVKTSSVATWFQTREAYCFFQDIPFLEAFAKGVVNKGLLKGVVVGYIQKDGGRIKGFLSRRAIILGGPLLSDDITDDELMILLKSLKSELRRKTIYIETRNFNNYSKWQYVFQEQDFAYEPHLNFHVKCDDLEEAESRIGKHRRRYIRLSLKEGATILENPSIEEVRIFYHLLEELYKTKVKSPLFPSLFFESLFLLDSCKFILVEFDGQIVGGSVCVFLESRTVFEWFACGKDGVYKNIYPSSLTKYGGIRFAHDKGCEIFDMMGAGKPNEKYGVRDFKAEFGGDLVEYGRNIYVCNHLLYGIGKLGVRILKKL